MDKYKKVNPTTDNLNKALGKALEQFSSNTEWTDINNWLLSLESIFKDNPSPFVIEKNLLAKRLNQCTNPILPEKVHECVLRVHQIMFFNMRASVDNDINDYVKLFAEDLGIYSLSILPFFTHTSVSEHRMFILNLLNEYYLDLGRELIPMLGGFAKALLPVYSQTTEEVLQKEISKFIVKLLHKAGRRYVIASLWSSILKYSDCRSAGVRMLSAIIDKMGFIQGEEDYQSSHGFSAEEEELRQEEINQIVHEQSKNPPQLTALEGQSPSYSEKKEGALQTAQSPMRNLQEQSGPLGGEKALTQNKALMHINEQENEDESHQVSEDHEHERQTNENLMKRSQQDLGLLLNFRSRANDGCVSEPSHAVKLNKVPLMVTPGLQSIKHGIDEDSNQNNYPHQSTLVVGSLIACLEDPSQFIKRGVLDFMFSHLRLKSEVLGESDKRLLVQAVLRLFRKKEISITKRVNRWLFGKENEENQFLITDKNAFVLPFIIDALKKIFELEPKDEEECVNPLKIIQNLYMEHCHLLESTINQVSLHLLRYIFNYSSGYQFSEAVLKAGRRFFENIPSYYTAIFRSLGEKFMEGVTEGNQHLAFESVRYIDYCYIKLMHHEHGIEQLDYITITLEYLSQGLEKFSDLHTTADFYYQIYIKDTNLLICNLLSRRRGVIKFMDKQKKKLDQRYLQETGMAELPLERLQYQGSIQQEQAKQQQKYITIANRLEKFFTGLGVRIRTTPNIQIYEDIYRLISIAMVKVQMHIPDSLVMQSLPKWFDTISSGIRVANPSISLAAIEAMIKCLLNEENHSVYSQFKFFITQDKSSRAGNDYQNLALQKLWGLLDFPHMHHKIIDLIVAFSKFFPYEFTETVKKSFSTHSDPEKQASIQRFSHFWRLTGFKYKDLLLSNRQFAELNKIGLFKMLDFLDDQNPLVRHSAKNWMVDSLPLFNRILEPLFFELMTVCGDWYTTPKGLLIIKNQYDTNHIFSTFRRIRSLLSNGSYAFLRYVYSKEISDSLESLRSKITDLTTSIFCDPSVGSPQLTESVVRKEPVLPKALEMAQEIGQEKSKRMTYIDILIIVSVKFVEGHALESMGIDFYNGNAGVNTSSIELLETMLNYIDNPKLCYRLVTYIIEPLCRVLKQAVINREYITQIQLLNLLKTIFFNSSFRKKGELEEVRAFFKNILTQDYFLESMLKGLYTPFSYVRAQFINFITTCIQLIADFLEPIKCTECIKRILFTYHQIIKEIKCSLVEEVLQEEEDCAGKLDEVELRKKSEKTVGLSRIVEMEIKAKQEEKLVKLSNNLQEVAKTNEILSILHGVSAVLNYFFDFDKMNISDMKFEFSNPYTFFDTFKTIVTLGFGSSEKTGRLIEKTEFLHNMETCQSILEDMSPVYETILRAWPLSEEFVRIATEEFTSIGSRVFNFEKFSKYNQVLKDLIIFVAEEKESIWGKIFSIMQPMFYKFPREMTEIYLRLWLRECSNVGGLPSQVAASNQDKLAIQPKANNTQFLMKILETVIVSNFPMQIVIHAFLETETLEQIRQFYEKRRKNRTMETLSYPISQKEAKLLYFLFVYFMYSKIDEKSINKDWLIETWSVILKSIKPFLESHSPTTAMWILDLLEMCATKYPPKEILTNQKFKTDLHAIINQLLKYVASVAAKKSVVFYEDPTKPSFEETGQSTNQKYRVVLPIPPSLFEIYKLKGKDKIESDFRLFEPVKPGDLHAIQGSDRLWAFKMLKKIGFKVLQSVYLSQKMHFGVIRACEWVEIILPTIENKSADNMLFAETASEVLHCLLSSAKIIFIKPLRNSILKIFNKEDFFICNKNMLKYWAEIIDWIVSFDKNNETFAEYLSKVNLSSSYFASETEENKKRIKSFERICFILYSGQRDKYANKIKALLLKIADVIRVAESVHPALLILILFSIRILILRLSQICLNQLFIDIWPMILAFLMQIFCKQMVKVEIANEISRNHNLLYAAIKLIEMISVANLGEFAQHQWIFVYDYFGVKLSLLEQSTQMSQILSQRPELTQLVSYTRKQAHSPFYYKPYLINYLSHYSIEYIPQDEGSQQVEYQPKKRIIIAKDSFVKSEQEVACYVLLMAQYLAMTNEYRIEAEKEEMEEVIVNDFIQLDSFIHRI